MSDRQAWLWACALCRRRTPVRCLRPKIATTAVGGGMDNGRQGPIRLCVTIVYPRPIRPLCLGNDAWKGSLAILLPSRCSRWGVNHRPRPTCDKSWVQYTVQNALRSAYLPMSYLGIRTSGRPGLVLAMPMSATWLGALGPELAVKLTAAECLPGPTRRQAGIHPHP